MLSPFSPGIAFASPVRNARVDEGEDGSGAGLSLTVATTAAAAVLLGWMLRRF